MLNDNDLKTLGLLSREQLAKPVPVEWPDEEENAYGAGLAPVLALTALFALGHYEQPHLSAAEALGIKIEVLTHVKDQRGKYHPTRRHVIKISSELPMDVLTQGNNPDAQVQADDDTNKRAVDFDETSGFLASTPRGAIVCETDEDGFLVSSVLSSLKPLEQIAAPEWLSWASVPPGWLQRELQHHLEQNDTWHNVVAAGLYARLSPPLNFSSQSAPAGAKLLEADLARPRNWFRDKLSAGQHESVDLLSMAEVDHLFREIDDLQHEMACDDLDWQRAVLNLCRSRDDLEGVRILLNETEIGPRISEVVESLDSEGSLLLRSVPVALTFRDERLRTVASFDPGAWWVSLVDQG
jgi:hypothetical protein